MALPLSERVAIVTGAGSGIGRAIALHLADLGACVVVNYKANQADAEATADEIRRLGRQSLAVAADVTNSDDVAALVEAAGALGPLDILVNNVGGLVERRPVVETDDALWAAVMELNATSAFRCARAVLPAMIARREGRIVNVSSIAAETGGPGGTAAYAAAKGALNSLTIALAREVAEHGIRVNAVAPGLIDTPFHARTERGFHERIAAIPMGRMGEPEEVARVVGFLASDRAQFITGQILTVAGGR